MAEHEGYIKIDRNMLRWRWATSPTTGWLFLIILLKANYKEMEFEGMTIKPGQLVTSYQSLCNLSGLSVQQCRTAIKKLKSTGELTSKSYPRYQVITVVNYNRYQEPTRRLTGKQQADSVTNPLNPKNPTYFSTRTSTRCDGVCDDCNSKDCGAYNTDNQQGYQQESQQASNRLATGKQQQEKGKKERNKGNKYNPPKSPLGGLDPSGEPQRGTDGFRAKAHLLLTEDEGTVDDIPTVYRDGTYQRFDNFRDYWRFRNQ